MSSGRLPRYAYERLEVGKGLALDTQRSGGPMGSASWRLTNGIADIEIYSDRGLMGAAAGGHGGPTYGVDVWARALGVRVNTDMELEEQVDFFANHLESITRLIQGEPEIDTRLRETNWVAVRDRLGLDTDAPRPGPPDSWIT